MNEQGRRASTLQETPFSAGLTWLTRHWLAGWLIATGGFIALPFVAPLLARMGWQRAAGVIYTLYLPTCHQLPHHSWFLFGPRFHYAWAEVQPFTGVAIDSPLSAFHAPVRAAAVGYQAAICQRDTAIWGAVFAASVVYAIWNHARAKQSKPPPKGLPLRLYLVAMIPIAVDGLTGLVGLRTSTPLLRTITGVLFGAATAWFVLPQLADGFREWDRMRHPEIQDPDVGRGT